MAVSKRNQNPISRSVDDAWGKFLPSGPAPLVLSVCLDDGRVFTLPVESEALAQRTAATIVREGFRAPLEGTNTPRGAFLLYPPHRISCIVADARDDDDVDEE